MKSIKVVNNIPPKKRSTPITKVELLGYSELLIGFCAVWLGYDLLGGIAIGVGATHIMRNILDHAK